MSVVMDHKDKAYAGSGQWEAVMARDASRDGSFVYAVKTTGVYCRPSCPSRLPNRHNVLFFETTAAAAESGFRACRRCHPDGQSLSQVASDVVARACRAIEDAEELPKLGELAALAGLSPSHFHRLFKTITGLTPRAYGAAERAKRLRTELEGAGSVTHAIYGAGYNSSSRFYETSNQILGMTPSAYKRGGKDEEIRFAVGESSFGSILVAQSVKGICAISLGEDPETLIRELEDRFPNARLIGGDRGFEQLVAGVVGFVEQPRIGLNLPLDVRGSAFQERVWRALREIPAGETVSYAQVAQVIGAPKAVRAVARACAANTIAVAIPCHRVVKMDGELSGYRWGVERKRALLAKEAQS